ncbi:MULTISPECIES: VOC family protein [unclassified Actinopolyspora]|uniref:VOC family protein n=1 Tax=unclassified Actinopolyspora TaxID=2639451 RepID=UPI0013F64D5E|nr:MULTISPECIES: VOC family protein [unclassified Actinopolyspora]NHD16069.1 VOC family protein [Actinopolyspora sp. BKK2]NHE74717.1 VOC family protein [Actinopolyspora sp. BKK1]
MITTDFAAGAPCWLDLGVPDPAGAQDFYGAVFGWRFESMDPESNRYGVFRSRGKVVAGLGSLDEEGARPAWMIYFNAADADEVAGRVRRAGGGVRVEPFDADGQARLAQFTDPLGAEFAVWQPRGSRGLEAVDESGSLMWVELFTTDSAAAVEFYGSLFGWSTREVPMPDGQGAYSIIRPAGGEENRAHGGIVQVGADFFDQHAGKPYFHPVFATADCDAAVARVSDGGGIVNMGPESTEGVGRLAVCSDPFGADFVVLAPDPS